MKTTCHCPEHPEIKLRRENYDTGFCIHCLKHHAMCCSVQYMSICERLKNHEGPHVDRFGYEWKESYME
jgi:hypothetical protein